MGYVYSTTLRKKRTHMTYEDRRTLEKMLRERRNAKKADRKTNKEIYESLGISKATFYREIKRGEVIQVDSELKEYKIYCANAAQGDYDYKATSKGPDLKIGNNHKAAAFIEKKIVEDGYSPYAVSVELKKKEDEFGLTLSTKTIYNYIHKEVFAGIRMVDLPRKGKGSRRGYKGVRKAPYEPGKSITKRPKEADERTELGHWEMDTVESGKKGKSCLLTMVDRCSRDALIFKLESQTQAEVQRVLDELENELGLEKFSEVFKSITVDNGGEFKDWMSIESSVTSEGKQRTSVYYCHPYSSWERGSNENFNGLIRRAIPKGSDISKYSESFIKILEEKINNYPRKIFDGMSAKEKREEMLAA